jgi:DNA repair exonuclease SbcCD ATPase subunit
MSDLSQRKVSRVLIMLEYGPGDPDSGEVYDLTALVPELCAPKEEECHASSVIELEVKFDRESYQHDWQPTTTVSFRAGRQFHLGSKAGRLQDAINAAIREMSNDRIERIHATQKRLSERMSKLQRELQGVGRSASQVGRCAERMSKLQRELQEERLRMAAAVRHQYPIARVTAAPLADVAKLEDGK